MEHVEELAGGYLKAMKYYLIEVESSKYKDRSMWLKGYR